MADAPAVAAPGGVVDGEAAPVVAPVVAPVPRDPMDQYLEDVVGMTRPGMRQHIVGRNTVRVWMVAHLILVQQQMTIGAHINFITVYY